MCFPIIHLNKCCRLHIQLSLSLVQVHFYFHCDEADIFRESCSGTFSGKSCLSLLHMVLGVLQSLVPAAASPFSTWPLYFCHNQPSMDMIVSILKWKYCLETGSFIYKLTWGRWVRVTSGRAGIIAQTMTIWHRQSEKNVKRYPKGEDDQVNRKTRWKLCFHKKEHLGL